MVTHSCTQLTFRRFLTWTILGYVYAMPLTGSASQSTSVPASLQKMIDARTAIETADVDCSHEIHYTNPSGRARRMFTHVTARCANDDVIWVRRGDDDGVVMRNEKGDPSPYYSGPLASLSTRESVWEKISGHPNASVGAKNDGLGVIDIRTVGLMFAPSFRDVSRTVLVDGDSDPPPRRYSERVHGHLYTVQADGEAGTITWWIDGSRGWNPTRVRLERDGQTVMESRSTLTRFEDRWFPERVEYFSKSWKNGNEPRATFTFREVECNKPHHPQSFTPRDIEIEPGVTGVALLDSNLHEKQHGFFDDAKGFVEDKEYARLRGLGPVSPAECVANLADPTQTLRFADQFETLWERYTRHFVSRRLLGAQQAAQAWRICDTCSKEAREYLERHRRELEQLLAKPQLADADSARVRTIFEPVNDIFEKRLKPGLDRLLTRKQVREANAPEAP